MKSAEIISFLREAAEEKYRHDNTLLRKEWHTIDMFLDRLEDLINYITQNEE